MGQKNKIRVIFLFHILPDQTLPFAIDIFTIRNHFVVLSFENFKGFTETETWDGHNLRDASTKQSELGLACLPDMSEHSIHRLLEHSHHILDTVDKAHFSIESSVLSHMACGKTWLSSKDYSYLKDSFKSAHSSLFVELRALCKKSISVKIFYFEKVRPTFGCTRENFGGFNLEKTLLSQGLTIRQEHFRINLENSSHLLIAKSQGTMSEKCFKVEIKVSFGHINRQFFGRLSQDREFLYLNFNPTSRTVGCGLAWASLDEASHLYGVLGPYIFGCFQKRLIVRRDHKLYRATTVTEDKENEFAMVTTHRDPASERYSLTYMLSCFENKKPISHREERLWGFGEHGYITTNFFDYLRRSEVCFRDKAIGASFFGRLLLLRTRKITKDHD